MQLLYMLQKEFSYFGLARNLIRRIISPNQDDLFYTFRTTFLGSSDWEKPSNTLFG